MRTIATSCAIGTLSMALAAGIAHAGNDLGAALAGGEASLDLRYRFEFVDQDGRDNTAEASTVRTRLGYRSGAFHGVTGFIEFSDTTAILFDDYQPLPGPGDTAVVVDPELTVLNRAYLEYGGLPDTTARIGRDRITLDNVRWIGNVGWRQQEQTYDAATLASNVLPDTTLTYAYLWQRNMITGARQEQNSHLLNAAYSGLPWAKITGYGYFLNFDDAAPALSTNTLGVRAAGCPRAVDNGSDPVRVARDTESHRSRVGGIGEV